MAKIYRGKLPKASLRGDVRPEIGGQRITVGNTGDTTQTQMLYRLNLLRDVFGRQSKFFKIENWDERVLPYAK